MSAKSWEPISLLTKTARPKFWFAEARSARNAVEIGQRALFWVAMNGVSQRKRVARRLFGEAGFEAGSHVAAGNGSLLYFVDIVLRRLE
tara:strand:- start:175 stop:441 length:267 start_codon:yes stop_codon:yes gene_type:complete